MFGIQHHRCKSGLICPAFSHPGISHLSSESLPGRIAGMIGGATICKVMVVIRRQMCMYPGLLKQLRHGIIKWFQRPPAPVQEICSARMQLPPCRNTRHAAYVMVVKYGGMTDEPLEIRHRHLLVLRLKAGHHRPAQGIKHHHNRFHITPPSVRTVCINTSARRCPLTGRSAPFPFYLLSLRPGTASAGRDLTADRTEYRVPASPDCGLA